MDIRDEKVWNERRWRWDEHGYSKAFRGSITPTDIDALVERKGYFLAIETKEWVPFDTLEDPPGIPRGQEICLEQMAKQPNWTVLYVAGEAADGAPWFIRQIGGTAIADLRGVESAEQRRDALYYYLKGWADWVERRP